MYVNHENWSDHYSHAACECIPVLCGLRFKIPKWPVFPAIVILISKFDHTKFFLDHLLILKKNKSVHMHRKSYSFMLLIIVFKNGIST